MQSMSFSTRHIHCAHILCPPTCLHEKKKDGCPVNLNRALVILAKEPCTSAKAPCVSAKEAYKKSHTKKKKDGCEQAYSWVLWETRRWMAKKNCLYAVFCWQGRDTCTVWMSLWHTNESCHTCMGDVTHEWVMSHRRESYDRWMSHVIHEWLMSHMNTWMSHVAQEGVIW